MAEIDEDYYKNLYKYKRENSKLNSKIKASDNIQNIHEWLRKVEDASERAINNTFNPKSDIKQLNKVKSNLNLSNNANRKNLVDIQTEICKKQDPYSEAHDLINGWIADKVRLDMDDDIFNYIDLNEMNQFASNEKEMERLKSELLYNGQRQEEATALDMDILAIKGVDYDKYDEEYLTRDIMNKIMKKKIVDPKKLAVTETTAERNKQFSVDTRLKIELRHQAVKENREKRKREVEEKRREKLEKKEIEMKAKMLVQKEEQDKRMREEVERQLIEQEAQKLRLEMAEKRFREEEMRKKIKEMEQLRIEREKQDLSNIQKKLELSQLENEIELKKNEIALKRAEDLADSYLKTKNLKKMRRIFSSWYGLILEMRLKTGKAKALADWKLSSKAFNAWKKLSITEKVKKEQELYQHVVKHENIKNSQATNFYNRKLIKKFFDEWKTYTKNQLVTKQIESERVVAKSRMQKFLEAVAEGGGKINDDEQIERSKSVEDLVDNSTLQSATRTVKSANKSKPRTSSRSEKTQRIRSDSIENVNVETSKYSDNELNKKVKDAMWPWVKTPFNNIASNFDNRFKAQEKLLHEQTKMIKEQQKLIEDLKYQQSQIAFKEQITLLEQIKAKQLELEKMQKSQYKQEKQLLRKKGEIMRMQQQNKRPSIVSSGTKTVDAAADDDDDDDDGSELEADNKSVNRNNLTTRTESQIDTSSRYSDGGGKKTDQFVRNMEERAKMREQMKREREEKRKKQEMEKLELLKAQQEEKMKLEEEEKRIKAAELKEKKRIQEKLDEKRNTERLKEQQALEKADNFYKKYLLRYYGMNGLKKLVAVKNSKMEKAVRYDSAKICARIFVSWRIMARSETSVKERIADEFYAKVLLKTYYFKGVKLFKQSLQIEMAKAGRFYRYNMKLKLFNSWRAYTTTERTKSVENETLVDEHNLRRIKVKYFKEWREFPAEMKRSRARQKRLEDLRSRVREIVPDFEPPPSSSINSSSSTNN